MRRLRPQLAVPLRALVVAAALTCVAASPLQAPFDRLVADRDVADGITLFHLTDDALIDPPAPISIWLLRLDPERVRLRAVLANDEVMGTETVSEMAARHGAVAAINAGFFLPNGDPAGLLKLNGRLISDTTRPRGAVGITEGGGKVRLLFDRVTATISLAIRHSFGRKTIVPIDGVDTTRARGKLMLFTPAYHADTDSAKGGLEWTASGRPTRIVRGPLDGGKTPIPPDGFVLSFGGRSPPTSLRRHQARRAGRSPVELRAPQRRCRGMGRGDGYHRRLRDSSPAAALTSRIGHRSNFLQDLPRPAIPGP